MALSAKRYLCIHDDLYRDCGGILLPYQSQTLQNNAGVIITMDSINSDTYSHTATQTLLLLVLVQILERIWKRLPFNLGKSPYTALHLPGDGILVGQLLSTFYSNKHY